MFFDSQSKPVLLQIIKKTKPHLSADTVTLPKGEALQIAFSHKVNDSKLLKIIRTNFESGLIKPP